MLVKLNSGRIAFVGIPGSIKDRVEVSKQVALTPETDMIVMEPDEFIENLRQLYLRTVSIKTINEMLTKAGN
jgi:hypothetical protein